MKNQRGFSLIELLIVVLLISLFVAIAVPSMLTARMAAYETGAVQGLRTIGAAEVAYAAVNGQNYALLDDLVAGGFLLDQRFENEFNGYRYIEKDLFGLDVSASYFEFPNGFSVVAEPISTSSGRYKYGIATDTVIRYQGLSGDGHDPLMCGERRCEVGDPIQ